MWHQNPVPGDFTAIPQMRSRDLVRYAGLPQHHPPEPPHPTNRRGVRAPGRPSPRHIKWELFENSVRHRVDGNPRKLRVKS